MYGKEINFLMNLLISECIKIPRETQQSDLDIHSWQHCVLGGAGSIEDKNSYRVVLFSFNLLSQSIESCEWIVNIGSCSYNYIDL